MKPTDKHPDIENLLTILSGRNRREAVHEGFCTICGGPATEFKDKLSEKEFTISGMCQKCQDEVFSDPEE
jgi:hypothetical protein